MLRFSISQPLTDWLFFSSGGRILRRQSQIAPVVQSRCNDGYYNVSCLSSWNIRDEYHTTEATIYCSVKKTKTKRPTNNSKIVLKTGGKKKQPEHTHGHVKKKEEEEEQVKRKWPESCLVYSRINRNKFLARSRGSGGRANRSELESQGAIKRIGPLRP